MWMRTRETLRWSWLLLHGCWTTALAINVRVGQTFYDSDPVIDELCDDAFSNGNNGPFGYPGQAESAATAIDVLLKVGFAGALALALLSRRRCRLLGVANLVVGGAGGVLASRAFALQSDQNPFCRPWAWVPWAQNSAVLVALALLAAWKLDRDEKAAPSFDSRHVGG
jgi:hypothetical protein